MASGAAVEVAQAGTSRAPKPNFASRVFGYDLFISFARLRAALTVTPPIWRAACGSATSPSSSAKTKRRLASSTLLKALYRSRTLVVIANRGTLQEPRWVRQEVEAYRSRYPDRPIIPINVGGALQDATVAEQTRRWLAFDEKIWLDESHDAVAQGIASDEMVTRLAMVPAGHSSNVKWRWVVGAIVAALVILSGAATWFGIYARKESTIAIAKASEAQARELAAYATGSLGDDPEKSILLGMQAVNATVELGQRPLPAAEEALHHAILSSQVRMTLRGHSLGVSGVAFSPDGKLLATASGDQTAKVWDAESGKELLTLRGHSFGVYGVAFSPDGKRLATASWDQTAKVWDSESGKELLTLTLRGRSVTTVSAVAFSPDGKRLATASDDQTAKVWDAESGKELLTLRGHSNSVFGVAFSPDGKRLATASDDQTAKVWDAERGKELLTLRGHSNIVFGVAVSPDGKRLATASEDQTAKVWNAESGKELLTLRGHWSSVNRVAFSPDGKRLATASGDQTARVWDAESGKELLTLRGHSDAVNGVAFSHDGKRLATASSDHTAKVWDAESGKELLTLRGHSDPVTAVAFSPDGKRLATASEDGTVQVYALDPRELLKLARTRVTRPFIADECQRYFQSPTCPPLP